MTERGYCTFNQPEKILKLSALIQEVRIVARNVDKEAGLCSNTAVIPRRNFRPTTEQAVAPQ